MVRELGGSYGRSESRGIIATNLFVQEAFESICARIDITDRHDDFSLLDHEMSSHPV